MNLTSARPAPENVSPAVSFSAPRIPEVPLSRFPLECDWSRLLYDGRSRQSISAAGMGEAENLHEYRFCLVQRHRPLFLGLEPEERV